ncbi:maleylpyruvate isomerase N-terminal domain-containing protein [Streptomyces erythrochromogenes]|uniref:maleylpyruvate isomerase N-terminal domain-containing protein n=1 Tax=Streptomyces erythrochromogenes TaxID=285574 RepID=UPI0036820A3E
MTEQLTTAAEPAVERFWQLLCVLGGRPAPAGIAEEGQWLTTALGANPAPGARNTRLEALYRDDSNPWPGGVLDAFTRVQDTVATIVRATAPDQFGLLTPCKDWTVRDLLDHLVWENVIWGGLAQGTPPAEGHTENHLGDNHIAAFETAASQAREAFRQPGMLDRSFGPAPAVAWSSNSSSNCSCMAGTSRPRSAATATRSPTSRTPPCRSSARSTGSCPAPLADPTPQHSPPEHAPALDHVAAFLGRRIPH